MPNSNPPAPTTASLITKIVVNAAPTSTTNITGFFATCLGFSLKNDSFVARLTISGSKRGLVRAPFEISSVPSVLASILGSRGGAVRVAISKYLSVQHLKMLNDRPKRKSREVGQRTDDDDGSDKKNDEQRTMCRQRAARHWNHFLPGQAARDCKRRNNEQKSSDQHIQSDRQVVPGRIGADASECASVIAGAAAVGVQDFRESMRAAITEVAGGRTIWTIPIVIL